MRKAPLRLLPPRWRDGGFEFRCRTCGDWWPLTDEFYSPKHGTARCKACWAEYHRNHEAARRGEPESVTGMRATRRAKLRLDPVKAEQKRMACRRWREANRDHLLQYNRDYRAANRDQLRATRIERAARKKAA